MFLPTTIALLLCLSTISIAALEKCPGAANDAYEEFEWKYTTAPIVAYGTVSSVTNNIVTFKVSCTLKGELKNPTLELTQPTEANNYTECHYLTANKNYIIYVEPKSPTTDKNAYQLANMEEIEVTSNSGNQFFDDQCEDTDDYGIDMTIFYTNGIDKCDKFQTVCNEKNRVSILALKYAPLDSKSIILGGIRKTVATPSGDNHIDDNSSEKIFGKKKDGGIGDERFRNNGKISTAIMSMVMFVASLVLLYNI